MKYYFFFLWTLMFSLSACASTNSDSLASEFPFLRFEYDVIVIQWESSSDLDSSKSKNGIVVFDYREKEVKVGFAKMNDPFLTTPLTKVSIDNKYETSRLDLFAWNAGFKALEMGKYDLFSNNMLGWSSRVVFEFYSENRTTVRKDFEFVGSSIFIEEFSERFQSGEKFQVEQAFKSNASNP